MFHWSSYIFVNLSTFHHKIEIRDQKPKVGTLLCKICSIYDSGNIMLSWKLPLPPAAVGATLAVSYKGTGPMNVFLVWALQFYVFLHSVW